MIRLHKNCKKPLEVDAEHSSPLWGTFWKCPVHGRMSVTDIVSRLEKPIHDPIGKKKQVKRLARMEKAIDALIDLEGDLGYKGVQCLDYLRSQVWELKRDQEDDDFEDAQAAQDRLNGVL
jgi:hypothetical protein